MKRTLVLLLLLSTSTLSLSALDLRVGPVSSGWNTFAVEAIVEGPTDWFADDLRPELGVEIGLAGTVTQAVAPFGLLWESYLERGWSWGFAGHALLGGAMVSTVPTLLWGGEAEIRCEWSWVPGLGLGLSAGGRYTLRGSQLSSGVFEVPVHLNLEFALGGEDKLEPSEGDEKDER